MSAPNIQGMQTAMVTEQLQGSQLRETVEYQVTGDAETTLLSGLLAVCARASNNLQNGSLNPGDIARVLEYLRKRFEDDQRSREAMAQYTMPNPLYDKRSLVNPLPDVPSPWQIYAGADPGYGSSYSSAGNSKTQELIDRLKLSCFKASDDGK